MCNQVKFLRHEQCARAVEVCHALALRCVEPAHAGVAEIEWDAYAHADDTDLLIVDEFAWDRQAAAVCQEDKAAAAAARSAQGKKAAPASAATSSASAPIDDSTRLMRDMIRLRYELYEPIVTLTIAGMRIMTAFSKSSDKNFSSREPAMLSLYLTK